MEVPSITTAKNMLAQAERMNPGAWVQHNIVTGNCAKAVAGVCGMNSDKAYVLGLLHDIGRRYGVTDMKHIIFGYNFMTEQGYSTSARICLTHSFPLKNIASYNGKNDCKEDETEFIKKFIDNAEYDDYDRLIQLCDAISFSNGATYLEKRLVDVVMRKGFNQLTVPKWKAFFELKNYFDKKTGCDIYKLLNI